MDLLAKQTLNQLGVIKIKLWVSSKSNASTIYKELLKMKADQVRRVDSENVIQLDSVFVQVCIKFTLIYWHHGTYKLTWQTDFNICE